MVNFGVVQDQLIIEDGNDEPLVLKPFQEAGICWLRARDSGLLADEPGLGKSAQLLKAAVEPVLIVAPAMILAAGVWDDEIAKWAPGIDATQVAYSSLAQLGPNGKVDRDALGFPTNPPKPQYRRRYGTKIGDEAHYLKGRKTNWTTAFMEVPAFRTELGTGTPIPNWAHESFMLLRMLYPEEAKSSRKYGSFWRWAKEWFDVQPSRFNPRAQEVGKLQRGLTWEEFRESNWGDKLLIRLRAEVLTDLPPLTWTGHKSEKDLHAMFRVKMGKEQQRVYNALRRDFVAWLETGTEVTAWTIPSQLVKLYKIATGLEVVDPTAKGSGKLEALRTLLGDRPRPTLVCAYYRDSVLAAARVAQKLGMSTAALHGGVDMVKRGQSIRAFQQGNIDVLISTIDVIGEGVTLHQGGADQFVMLERHWVPSKNIQVWRRLHRMGVKVPITGIDLVTEGTVDERLLDVIYEKTDEQASALGIDEWKWLA